jgi:purine-binding chemotaxis protein CheW
MSGAAKVGEDKERRYVASEGAEQLLTFVLEEQEYALDIASVAQVVRMVAITRSPKAPEAVVGMINVRGKVIPVVSLRRLMGLAEKTYGLNDHLLIVQAGNRMAALLVDMVREVLIVPAASLEPPIKVAPRVMRNLAAVAKLGDRLLLVLDLVKALSFLEEENERVLTDVGPWQERMQELFAEMTRSARA